MKQYEERQCIYKNEPRNKSKNLSILPIFRSGNSRQSFEEVGQFQPAFIEKNYTRSCYKHKNISFIRITISFSISKSEHSDFGDTTAVKTSNFSNLMDGGWQLS